MIRRTMVLVGIAGAVAASAAPAVGAATTATAVFKVPFSLSAAAKADIAACVGENVTVSGGEFNVVIHITDTGNGGFVFDFHRNVINATATGDTTGTTYRATGHLQDVEASSANGTSVFTFPLTLNFVGEGGAGHFTATGPEHVTVTPDGTLTSSFDFFEVSCS